MQRTSYGVTDVGLIRDDNEDSLLRLDVDGLYLVADGVGGENAGDRASKLAVATLNEGAHELAELVAKADDDGGEATRRAVFDALVAYVERSNSDVFAASQNDEDLRGMMTTLTVVLLARSAAYIAHVGDSRVYLLRERELEQLTVDHTLAEELVRAGRLSREEISTFRFRNVLARAVGEKSSLDVDLLYVDLMPDDRLLLCTDGLSDYVAHDDVVELLLDKRASNPARLLVDAANDHGGGDNSTALVVDLSLTVEETKTNITAVQAMDHSSKITVIQTLFFCRHLTTDEMMKVLRYVHESRFKRGDVIVRQGEDGQDLYMLAEGQLEVLVDGVRVNTMREGAHFGEIALVSGQRRSAEVVALTDVRTFQMSRAGFYDLSQKDQSIAVKMLWAFSQTLAKRVIRLSRDVAETRKNRPK
jgi:PPM family protein phosphatase